jgi:trehalose-6-phosphatase
MAVEDRLQIGSEVTVSAGAFLGSRGVVLRVLPARQRVQILLDFLGRTTMAEVDRETLSVEGRSMADLLPALVATPRTNIAIASAA